MFFFGVQLFQRDFWRLTVGTRTTKFKGKAEKDLIGSPDNEVDLQHSMFSVALQRAWMPLKSDGLYIGAGFEIARATSAKLMLDENELPIADEDLPTYVGMQGIGGYQIQLPASFSVFVEARWLGFFNQSPMVTGYELVGAAGYWF